MKSLALKLKELFGEDDLIKANIVRSFSQQVKDSSTSIDNHFKEKNWNELYKEAHKLQSSSRLLGFSVTADLLRNIETLSKENATEENISEDFSKLTTQLITVDATCSEFLNTLAQ